MPGSVIHTPVRSPRISSIEERCRNRWPRDRQATASQALRSGNHPYVGGLRSLGARFTVCHADLARAIATRHLKEQVEAMERRRELLRIEVFAIVKDMLDRGEHPVQSCVQKMLSSDSIRAFQELQHLAGGDDPGD